MFIAQENTLWNDLPSYVSKNELPNFQLLIEFRAYFWREKYEFQIVYKNLYKLYNVSDSEWASGRMSDLNFKFSEIYM